MVCVQLHVPTALPPVGLRLDVANNKIPSPRLSLKTGENTKSLQPNQITYRYKFWKPPWKQTSACKSKIKVVFILQHYTRESVRDSARYLNNLRTNYVGRTAKQFSVSAVSNVWVARGNSKGSSNSHSFAVSRVPLTPVGFLLSLPLLARNLRSRHTKMKLLSPALCWALCFSYRVQRSRYFNGA